MGLHRIKIDHVQLIIMVDKIAGLHITVANTFEHHFLEQTGKCLHYRLELITLELLRMVKIIVKITPRGLTQAISSSTGIKNIIIL